MFWYKIYRPSFASQAFTGTINPDVFRLNFIFRLRQVEVLI